MGLAVAFLVQVMTQLRGVGGVKFGFERIEPRKDGEQIGCVRLLLARHGGQVLVQRAGEPGEGFFLLRGHVHHGCFFDGDSFSSRSISASYGVVSPCTAAFFSSHSTCSRRISRVSCS